MNLTSTATPYAPKPARTWAEGGLFKHITSGNIYLVNVYHNIAVCLHHANKLRVGAASALSDHTEVMFEPFYGSITITSTEQ